MERTCSFCGKYFESYPEDKQRYCSEECHQKYLERQRLHHILKLDIHENCVFCGKKIEGKKRGTKYCSDFCRRKARDIKNGVVEDHGELTKICPVCGDEFRTWKSKKITCSDKCSKKWRSCQTQDQKDKRREYDHQKYLKTHPNAKTQEEISTAAKIRKLAEAPLREQKAKEREARKVEQAKRRAEKEKQKQANIKYWQEYEAEHECVICGSKYIAHHPFSKYCSKTCARRNTRTRDSRNRYKNITVDKGITLPKLAKRDHNQCQICGLFVDWNDYIETDKTIICGDMYPSIDHILPISLGGKHSWNNVQLAHRGCNTRKSNVHVQELKEKDYVLRHSVPTK